MQIILYLLFNHFSSNIMQNTEKSHQYIYELKVKCNLKISRIRVFYKSTQNGIISSRKTFPIILYYKIKLI